MIHLLTIDSMQTYQGIIGIECGVHIMVWAKLKLNDYFTTETESKIQQYILENIEIIPSMSVHELGVATGTSDSAVTRFCKKLGVDGYKELKAELARILPKRDQSYIRANNQISRDDSVADILSKTTQSACTILQTSEKLLDIAALEKAIEYIDLAENVYLIGMGNSASVATDFLYKLKRVQVPAHFSNNYHLQLVEASFFTPKDVIFAITVSGKTYEAVKMLEIAKEKGAKTICLTQVGHLPSDPYTDIKLAIPFTENEVCEGSLAARLTQLNIIDAIFLGIVCKRYDTAQAEIEEIRKLAQDRKLE